MLRAERRIGEGKTGRVKCAGGPTLLVTEGELGMGKMTLSGALAICVAAGAAQPAGAPPSAPVGAPATGPASSSAPAGPATRRAEPLPAGAVARFGEARLHHGGCIQYLVFSPDGRLLVSAGRGYNQPRPIFCVWDPATGDLVRQFAGTEQGMGVAFAAPKVLVDLDNARSVFYDLETGGDAAGFASGKIPGRGMDVSPDGKMLAINFVGRNMQVADTAGGQVKYRLGSGEWVRFSPDGKYVLVVAGAREAKERSALYDAATGKLVRNIDTAGLQLHAPCFSPDGARFAACAQACAPGQVMVWETATGKLLHKVADIAGDGGNVSFSSDGKRLAVAGGSGVVTILEPPKEKPVAQIQAYTQYIQRAVFSPDGRYLAAGGDNGQIRIWDGQTYKELHAESGNRAEVNDAAVSPCGKFVLTGGVDGTARLWDAAGGRELRRLADSNMPVTAVAFGGGRGGALLAAAGKGETAAVYEVPGGRLLRSVRVPNGASAYVGFAAGRNSLLAVGPSGSLSTIDLAVGKVTAAGPADKAAVAGHIAVTPDGRLAASAAGLVTSVWETAGGRRRGVFGTGSGCEVRATLDRFGSLVGSLDATDAGMKVVIYEIDSGRPCREIAVPKGTPVGDEGQSAMAFSNDGAVLAVGDMQGTIFLASVRSGEQLGRRAGHRNRITSLAFSADDTFLLSGSADTTAIMWKLDDIRWPRPAAAKLDDAALDRLWGELASGDPGKGRQAAVALAAGGDQAAEFLGKRLEAARGPTEQEIQKLIEGLGSDQFAVRERSFGELSKLGVLVVAALRKARKESPVEEVRTRAAQLLAAIDDPAQRTGEVIRQMRAVHALERVGTAKALAVLESLANGLAGANLTERAREAAERLAISRGAGR